MARTFPTVALPGVDQDVITEIHAERDARRRVRLLWSVAMLATGRAAYAGTVPAAVVARRRAANRVARASRRVNRRRVA